MLTTADFGIAGTVPHRTMTTRYVKVMRAFIWQGVPTKVGDVLELPTPFAVEVVSYNKAAFVENPATVSEPAPADAAPAADAVARKPAGRGRAKE